MHVLFVVMLPSIRRAPWMYPCNATETSSSSRASCGGVGRAPDLCNQRLSPVVVSGVVSDQLMLFLHHRLRVEGQSDLPQWRFVAKVGVLSRRARHQPPHLRNEILIVILLAE
jgi:hypothetical protein